MLRQTAGRTDDHLQRSDYHWLLSMSSKLNVSILILLEFTSEIEGHFFKVPQCEISQPEFPISDIVGKVMNDAAQRYVWSLKNTFFHFTLLDPYNCHSPGLLNGFLSDVESNK